MYKMLASLLCVSVFIVCLIASVRWGIADSWAQRGYELENVWDGGQFDEAQWGLAYQFLQKASEFDPVHPVYKQRLARLHMLSTSNDQFSPIQRKEALLTSLKLLEDAIEIRPSWGPTWAEYALVLHLSGGERDVYEEAILKAITYGPWEPMVIRLIAWMAGDGFSSLSTQLQQEAAEAVSRGIRSPVKGLTGDVIDRIYDNALLKQALIPIVLPYLLEGNWKPANQLGFFKFVDWVWNDLSADEKKTLEANVMSTIRQLNPAYAWVDKFRNAKFGARICELSLIESPNNHRLNRWCSAMQGMRPN